LGVAIALLRFVYLACIITLALYTCGQIYVLFVYLRHYYADRRHKLDTAAFRDDQLPRVTVQLPLFNERYVARRIIDTVAAMDYPRHKLHIQVLDDSTDDTLETTQSRVAQLKADGLDIELIHRVDRKGYKAGALANALTRTDADLIAIFDADFIPARDFLRRTVPYFLTDERIGVVQTRWGHLNDDYNLLTRSQALAIDAHFAVEQYARSAGDLLFSFNGTCGIWRRQCIEDAGGWEADTLTEDFDLSYRAQIKGWRFKFVRDVVVPGEIPAQIYAYKQQQSRWAKGSTQVLMKLFWPLLRSDLSWRKRILGVLQLFQYTIQPVMLLTVLLTPLMMLTNSLDGLSIAPLGFLGLAAPALCILGQQALYPDWAWRSLYFPLLMIFSSGMTVNNSRAAVSALLRRPGEFKRTPKFSMMGKANRQVRGTYSARTGSDILWEFVFGLYTLFGGLVAQEVAPSFVPYFFLYSTALFSIAAWSIADRIAAQRPYREPITADSEPLGQPGR